MVFLPALIPGLAFGLEFLWPDDEDPMSALIIHFFVFRFMFFWGLSNEQQLPPGN